MKFRLLIYDPDRTIKGRHVGEWMLAHTYDDDTPQWVKEANAIRGQYINRKAIILYAETKRIRLPIQDDATALSMGPGDWLHDEDNPSTWSEGHKQYHRRKSCISDLCELQADQPLTTEQKTAVVGIVQKWSITRSAFRELDEKPVYWGYEIDCGGVKKTWHWKLRQTRNDPSVPLFQALSSETPCL